MKTAQIDKEVNVGSGSHEGMSGKHNEDSLGVFGWQADRKTKLIVGVVADGVGGQIAGEVASRLAVDTVKSYFDNLDAISDVNVHLDEAIKAANLAVYEASQKNPQYHGMSTTMAIAAILNGSLFTAHVGDSRIYLFRQGNLRQISIDHTWAQEAIEAGLLTPEQAKTHPNRNVIRRHLGGSPQVEVDHRLVVEPGQVPKDRLANQGMEVKAGDTLLICSDGLTDMISDDSVHQSLYANYLDLEAATNELIEKANQAGGKDNITVVILQVAPAEPLPAAVPPASAEPTRVGAAAAATVKVSQPAEPVPAAEPPETSSGRGVVFFLAGGVFAVVVVAVILAVVFLVLGGDDDEQPAASATAPAVIPVEEVTSTLGAPATAAIFTAEATLGSVETIESEATPEDTPELIPTLRPTNTATATRIPPTATSTPTDTPAAAPTSGGSGGQPRPTNTVPPPPG